MDRLRDVHPLKRCRLRACVKNEWRIKRTIFPCHIKMPRCIETLTTGTQCTRTVAEEGHRCQQHHEIHALKVQQAGPELEGRCNVFLRRRQGAEQRWARCGRHPVQDHTTCVLHTNVVERRAEARRRMEERRAQLRQERQVLIQRVTGVYRQRIQSGQITLHQALEDITVETEQGVIPWFIRHHVIDNLADLITDVDIATARENLRLLAMQIMIRRDHAAGRLPGGTRAAPRPVTLQEIAVDRQNVHRRDVSEQTNKGTELLLGQKIPPSPRTCQMILGAWIIYGFGDARIRDVLRVYDDMQHWYSKPTCRHQNDFLYKRMLDGLWVLITSRPSEIHFELARRLYEECSEAAGQCCEGHLTRLVNVMVGFDEAFQPPVSWKDVIGDKLALISKTDAPRAEKIASATQMMNELRVPEEERRVWIEALE